MSSPANLTLHTWSSSYLCTGPKVSKDGEDAESGSWIAAWRGCAAMADAAHRKSAHAWGDVLILCEGREGG